MSSSTNVTGEKEETIFDTFKEIKIRNEILKKSTYAQFWKHTYTSQHRLLTSFHGEKRRMQMTFLQTQVPSSKTPSDYKKTLFSFDAKKIHPIDQIDMHR